MGGMGIDFWGMERREKKKKRLDLVVKKIE